ncbi:hypothetical protein ACQEVY_04975 [Streptomyces sp. CA-288835]|uniref:hypothetical protein n=1 Tax=Streptomyces sp. CA-288835 TaxID=3240069 RepID=UPI003D8F4533
MDARQGLAFRAGDDGGYVGDDVGALVVAALGHAREVAGPVGAAAARPAGLGLKRRLDPYPRGLLATALGARPEPSAPDHQKVLHQDRSELLDPRRNGAAGEAGVKPLEQFAGVGPRLPEAGDGVAGPGAQAHRPPVAFGPLGVTSSSNSSGASRAMSSSAARTASVSRSRRVNSRAADGT